MEEVSETELAHSQGGFPPRGEVPFTETNRSPRFGTIDRDFLLSAPRRASQAERRTEEGRQGAPPTPWVIGLSSGLARSTSGPISLRGCVVGRLLEEVCQPVCAATGETYVAVVSGQPRVLGYYTLAPSHFEFIRAPAELLKGLPKHPLPSFFWRGWPSPNPSAAKGWAEFLLFDAFERCLRVAREVAFRAIEVEAIDDRAAAFYGKYGFLPFPSDPRHLAIALETVQEVLGDSSTG